MSEPDTVTEEPTTEEPVADELTNVVAELLTLASEAETDTVSS